MHATGPFEVDLTPQPQAEGVGDPSVARMAIRKRFHGDLDGTSRGEMLATRTDVEGSAGYVALERVTATLHGRSGSFSLQHSGLMDRGAKSLTITVLPDSATGELAGLAGTMDIVFEGGGHTYVFDYTLPG
ncbi:DUF3224 domain-containing protein [Tundrisphaera sp. TA3]|uniref:DUF3224 domain-containing protein n=1 Tax=Tundrisphaera sp. TA3 TaxID=3435775 RepID=UPI003EBED6BF